MCSVTFYLLFYPIPTEWKFFTYCSTPPLQFMSKFTELPSSSCLFSYLMLECEFKTLDLSLASSNVYYSYSTVGVCSSLWTKRNWNTVVRGNVLPDLTDVQSGHDGAHGAIPGLANTTGSFVDACPTAHTWCVQPGCFTEKTLEPLCCVGTACQNTSTGTLVPGVFLAPGHTDVASQVLQHLSWVLLAWQSACSHWPPGGKTPFIQLCRMFLVVSMELQVALTVFIAETSSTRIVHPTMICHGNHKAVIHYLKCC